MARYAKASYEQKRKAMIFPFHRRPLRKIFLFTFYTYKESLALFLSLAHTPAHSLLSYSPKPACRRLRRMDQIGRKNQSVIVLALALAKGYPRVETNTEINRTERRVSVMNDNESR